MTEFTVTGSYTGGPPFTSSMLLPAQTTPFAYTTSGRPAHCDFSVYCPLATVTNSGGQPVMSGQQCSAGPMYEPEMDLVSMKRECLPYGYYNLYNYDEYVSDGETTMGAFWQEWKSEVSTVAYPGTYCPSGWAQACTTTIQDAGTQYPQIWCCPGDEWECASERYPGHPDAPERLCRSAMTQSTTVWMQWWPPFTTGNSILSIWSMDVTEEAEASAAATVFYNAMPLEWTEGAQATPTPTGSNTAQSEVAGETTTSGPTSSVVNPTSPSEAEQEGSQEYDDSGKKDGLSKSAVAGVAVGATIGVIALLAGFIYFYRQQRLMAKQDANNNNNFFNNKPELDGAAAGGATGSAIALTAYEADKYKVDVTNIAELPAERMDDDERVEMDPTETARVEMPAVERRAELHADWDVPEVDGTATAAVGGGGGVVGGNGRKASEPKVSPLTPESPIVRDRG